MQDPRDNYQSGLAQVRHADKAARALRRALNLGDAGKGHGWNPKPGSRWKRTRAKVGHHLAKVRFLRKLALNAAHIH